MKMYKSIKSLSVLLFALFFAAAAQAQSGTTPTTRGKDAEKEMKAQKKSDSLGDELKLSPEQRAQFKKADDDYRVKSKAAKTAKKEDVNLFRDERKRAHKSVLNAEQSAKYDEIMARKEAKKARKDDKHPKKGNKVKKEHREGEH